MLSMFVGRLVTFTHATWSNAYRRIIGSDRQALWCVVMFVIGIICSLCTLCLASIPLDGKNRFDFKQQMSLSDCGDKLSSWVFCFSPWNCDTSEKVSDPHRVSNGSSWSCQLSLAAPPFIKYSCHVVSCCITCEKKRQKMHVSFEDLLVWLGLSNETLELGKFHHQFLGPWHLCRGTAFRGGTAPLGGGAKVVSWKILPWMLPGFCLSLN